ncbi:MAG: DNA-binding protein, partial [Bacteroidaceae bacterium]|nr:DNA-binding protein [Bacteroidaceae bacterium]
APLQLPPQGGRDLKIVSANELHKITIKVPSLVNVEGEVFYKDIAVLAYPAKFFDDRKPKCSAEFPFKATEPADVVMSYDAPFTLRSVKVVTGGNNIQAHRWTISASDDGVSYKEICKIEPARQGWQNTDAQSTYSIPTTKAKYFKFHLTNEGSNPGAEDMDAAKWKANLKIADLQLSSEPVIDGFEGKSAVAWRVSKEKDYGNEECLQRKDIINLTEYCENGVFDIQKIKDRQLLKQLKNSKLWHIVRIGYTSTGHQNATGGGGKGLESDKFDKRIVRKQFDNWFAKIYNHVPKATAQKVLTRLHIDSWECGSQNWSENFAAEFRERRGYDLNDWLLLYAGVPVETVEKSDAVLRDVRTTIGELINDVFFTVAKECAEEYGVLLSTECVAPTMVSDGLAHYKFSDIPMGEFWLNSPTHDKPNDMLDAISGAHIYGKNIIQAEGFTEVRGTWDEHPAMLKSLLDRNYCFGINSIVFHVMTHNPYLDKKPSNLQTRFS